MQANRLLGRRNRRKQKRSENRTLFGSIILCLITLTAVTVCMIMVLRYRAIQMENTTVLNELDNLRLEQEATYTQGEVEALLTQARQETEDETKDGILEELKGLMASGESTIDMLKYFFPDQIVVADAGAYHFFPILQDLKHHTYKQEQLQLDEDQVMQYIVNGEVVSHKGIDVSRYQEDIDWEAVAEDGVEYAFIRVGIRGYTEGEIIGDSSFEDNIKGALSNGIQAGVYFFTQATSVEEAEEEAKYVLDQIEPYDVTYPVVIDIEAVANENARTADLTPEERTQYCIAFCDMIRKAGYTPMIYGNIKTFMLMLDIQQLEDYEKWYAYYDDQIYYPYAFSIWQYSDSGNVDGIKGKVDMNISFEDWNHE